MVHLLVEKKADTWGLNMVGLMEWRKVALMAVLMALTMVVLMVDLRVLKMVVLSAALMVELLGPWTVV